MLWITHMPCMQYIFDLRGRSTKRFSYISCIFWQIFAYLRPWPVEGSSLSRPVNYGSIGQGLKYAKNKIKCKKQHFIELGLLVDTINIFCIFCIFCLHIFYKYANLTYVAWYAYLSLIWKYSCRLTFNFAQGCFLLRWRGQQHRLSWSDEFQCSWWQDEIWGPGIMAENQAGIKLPDSESPGYWHAQCLSWVSHCSS